MSQTPTPVVQRIRIGSLLQVLILVAVLLTSAATVTLSVVYHRNTRAVLGANYRNCLDRVVRTQLIRDVEIADRAEQRQLRAIITDNPMLPTATKNGEIAVFAAKIDADDRFLAVPIVSCEALRP